MHGSGNYPMSWNRYENDWQDGWKDAWKSPGWYEQPSDGAWTQYDAYDSWQPGSTGVNMYANTGAGPQVQMQSGGLSAGGQLGASREPQRRAMPQPVSFDALRQLQGDVVGSREGGRVNTGLSFDAMRRHQGDVVNSREGVPVNTGLSFDALRRQQGDDGFSRDGGRVNTGLSFDAMRRLQGDSVDTREATSMMGKLHLDEESTSASGARADSSDSEADQRGADRLGKEATQDEKDEAELVVRTAFREAKERDRLRGKVNKASANELQAMLNARLKQPSGTR